MPTKNGSKKNSSTRANSILARLNFGFVAVAIFALLFGGIGGYYIGRSHAATTGCVYNTYSTQIGGSYSRCVADLQYVLDNWHFHNGKGTYITQDGYYGTNTKNLVVAFQKWVGIPADGATGVDTWYWLCDSASYQHFIYDDAGCVGRWPGMMSNPYKP